ncbi:MAG: outer membrane protein assembly factor BamC [Ectothiorhodospiraceae bacterium AqS1]|nr:outer membrane protein assembly factor BamC [Ectothiorhodospiraceae bacterium AqS1]
MQSSRQAGKNRIEASRIEVRIAAKKKRSIEDGASFRFSIDAPRIVLALIALSALSGCTRTVTVDDLLPERQPPYRSSASLPPLEMPPDLERTAINDPLALPGEGVTHSQSTARNGASAGAVLPKVESVSIERDGNRRWLVAEAEAEVLWPRLREFWLRQGFNLVREESAAGVMETDWLERSGDLPIGAIPALLGNISRILYGVGVRDQYHTRVERGEKPGTTEIYVSHRGTERIFSDGDATGQRQREGVGEMIWKPLGADPGLEAEMLTRIMIFLGFEASEADALIAGAPPSTTPARIESDERYPLSLRLDTDRKSAWQRLGAALDRAGIGVEERDAAQGVYSVSYLDDADKASASWLSVLKFWEGSDSNEAESKTHRLILIEETVEGASPHTRIVVQNEAGGADASPAAMRLLSVLQDHL